MKKEEHKKRSENVTSYMDEKPKEEESRDMFKLRMELKDANKQLEKALDKKEQLQEKIAELQIRIEWLGSVTSKVMKQEQMELPLGEKKKDKAA